MTVIQNIGREGGEGEINRYTEKVKEREKHVTSTKLSCWMLMTDGPFYHEQNRGVLESKSVN